MAALDVIEMLLLRRDASARCEPNDCGCRDPWTCRCDRPPISPEAVLASVILLNGVGSWPIDDLRRAWPLARNDFERSLVAKAAEVAMAVAA
ncbi:hypothetical protein [Dietzia maris]|uniref:hypothetical protein n=1 Tax=Dietzia maris TaxID=37915 RepID=UPI00104FEB00